jgi:hypothetical protein
MMPLSCAINLIECIDRFDFAVMQYRYLGSENFLESCLAVLGHL